MLEQKLEEFKTLGIYCVKLFFGSQSAGADDIDIPMEKREIIITGVPVGVLGGSRAFFKGTLETLENFDFRKKPILLSNPPKQKDLEIPGWYIWGTPSAMEDIMSNGIMGKKWLEESKSRTRRKKIQKAGKK